MHSSLRKEYLYIKILIKQDTLSNKEGNLSTIFNAHIGIL